MKKLLVSLAVAGVLAGCATTQEQTKTQAKAELNQVKAEVTQTIATMTALVKDPQLSEFRKNKGQSDAWVKHADKDNGLGDVGSSSITAFPGEEGSARIRFMKSSDDFSALPGLSQTVNGLKPNTDYQLSFYYEDRKGMNSPSSAIAGIEAQGKTLAEKNIHVSQLANAPEADRKSFRKVDVQFNSGANVSATIYVKMKLDPSAVSGDDFAKGTEVRVDEFSLSEVK